MRMFPNLKLATVKKKTDKYVGDLRQKLLLPAEVIEDHKIFRDGEETEIEMSPAVEEK